jgi:hypothetical protein
LIGAETPLQTWMNVDRDRLRHGRPPAVQRPLKAILTDVRLMLPVAV